MSKLGTIARYGLQMPGLSSQARRVLGNMAACQTEAMGFNLARCSKDCGYEEYHYNSCRDRHCPLCQGYARARWVRDRLDELLPCAYFHVVFTVPKELRTLAQAHKRVFFSSLFTAVHGALLKVGAHDKHLGGRIGGFSVLHTWNQKLAFHPHVHCIVPGGALSTDRTRWITGSASYLLPTRKLALVYRGLLLSSLEKASQRGDFQGCAPAWIRQCLQKAASKDWVVYAKPPFGGSAQVVKYLGRYTHRVGISEQRMVSCSPSLVRFTWLDRAHGNARQVLEQSTESFIDKFVLHLLPKGLRKIRYFGIMSNRDRGANRQHILALMEAQNLVPLQELPSPHTENPAEKQVRTEPLCQSCGAAMASAPTREHGCDESETTVLATGDRLRFRRIMKQGQSPPVHVS